MRWCEVFIVHMATILHTYVHHSHAVCEETGKNKVKVS